jgi:hypothetical protein
MADTWLAIYDPAEPRDPKSLDRAADVDTSRLPAGWAWVEFDGPPSIDLVWDPSVPAMVPVVPPPPVPAADALPRWVYTTAQGAIVAAGATEAIPAPYQSAGATEAHYLADYPDASMHWDRAARAYAARPEPNPTLERTLIFPLAAQLRDLLALQDAARAAGLASTPVLDARIAEVRTDLALLAGAYETGR